MLKRVDSSASTQSGAPAFAILRRELEGGACVVSVEGELDLSTAPRLKRMLMESLETGQSRLVLDLSLTTFMDSTALGVLVAVNRRADLGGPLTIVCPRENVLQIFQFSGTDGAFAIFSTLEQALEHLPGAVAGTG